MACSKEDEKVDLLQPEILSKDELIRIFRQRNIQTEDPVERMDKYELVELFYNQVLPLPQRKYRKNRRGKQMTEKQRITELKRKRSHLLTDEAAKKRKTDTIQSGLVTSYNIGSVQRIKPPPSAINFERKTISLSGKKISSVEDRLKPPLTVKSEKTKICLSGNQKTTKPDNTSSCIESSSDANKSTNGGSSTVRMLEKTLTIVRPKSVKETKNNSLVVEKKIQRKPLKLKRDPKLSLVTLKNEISTSNIDTDIETALKSPTIRDSVSNHLECHVASRQGDCKTNEKKLRQPSDSDSGSEENIARKFKKTKITWP